MQKSLKINSFGASELMHRMNLSGCLDSATFNQENCSRILDNLTIGFSQLPKGPITNRKVMFGITASFHSLAILLNCTLLLLLYKDPLKRFRNSSSYLILNLAVIDLSGASINLFLQISNLGMSFTKFLLSLVAATTHCSFITLMFVSFDRFLAIAYSLQYRSLVLPKRIIAMILFAWVTSLSLSVLLYFVPQISAHLAGTGFYAVNIFILTGTILAIYPLTYRKFRSQRRQLFSLNSTNQQLRREKLKTEKNLAKTMFLVSLSLILFTSPYLVMFLFVITGCNSCILNKHVLNFWTFYRCFFALHFGLNPVIYAWRLPSYRKSLRILLTCNLNDSEVVNRNRSGP